MTVPPLPRSFEEAAQLQAAVEKELDRICSSSSFRSSRKSCEFLRYVVRVALDGRTDSLKERSIGIDLLGRDSSYDPSSDATVRVRANEVRKRLASFYGEDRDSPEYRIILPSGRYIPQFLPRAAEQHQQEPVFSVPTTATHQDENELAEEPGIAPLNTVVLMRPALIALFLCVLLLRQQIGNRGNHLLFWDHLLQGRTAVTLSLTDENPSSNTELEKGIYPLIWLSGRYGIYPHIRYTQDEDRSSLDSANLHISFVSPTAIVEDNRIPFLITNVQGRPTLTERNGEKVQPDKKRAALLTIRPEANSELWIQGTDGAAIKQLTESLIQEHNFPISLTRAISQKLPAELVMSIDNNGLATVHTYVPIS